jgi:hypothetical protein
MKNLPWVYILFGVGALYMVYKWGQSEAECKKVGEECINPNRG